MAMGDGRSKVWAAFMKKRTTPGEVGPWEPMTRSTQPALGAKSDASTRFPIRQEVRVHRMFGRGGGRSGSNQPDGSVLILRYLE
jgi:hypothetical protein